jgi:hypothetical protein
MIQPISAKRLALAALAGGLVLFVWGALAWMVLPLHDSIKPLPDENTMVSSMQRANAPRGVYFTGDPQQGVKPQMLIVYTPQSVVLSGGQFARTLLFDVLAAFGVAWLLSRAAAKTFAARVLFVAIAGGVIAAVIVDLANWNWFAYPGDYTLASMADKVIGWALTGLALAAIVRPPAPPVTVAA